MKALLFSIFSLGFLAPNLLAQTLEAKPDDPAFEKFQPVRAPAPASLLLQKGDRLAICGDSITEQRMYSRAMETYLTVCVPDLEISVRQYGWGGETAPGFLARMTNDCLRFKPTIATTCYGMNDHGYKPYEESIGKRYRTAQTAIVQAFQAAGARVILGSPGCVGLNKNWDAASVEAKNLNLCTLRNIDVEIVGQTHAAGFADVFWPMLTAGVAAQKKYAPTYAIAGGDGVHPGWAGSFVMAYAFLNAMGLDGDLGTVTLDWKAHTASATKGHQVLACDGREIKVKSARYPFCATGDASKDNNIRSAMSLIPFNAALNRLTLVVTGAPEGNYQLQWGEQSRRFSASRLAKGINLAEEFESNPFSASFAKVDAAVATKQNYETRQIKEMFHGPEGKLDMQTIESLTERVRAPLVESIKTAFVPVTHTITVQPE
jgi:hypothetical protein